MSETIIVAQDGSGGYEKIQDAIDAAENRDTVRVYEGTYEERVRWTRVLTLSGRPPV